jgi:3-hydroxyisobutyrate dehydrogenase-like beta-hydroxyacid dehydrogenase
MARIVILHPGAMGAAVGRALRDAGHEVGWMPAGRSAASAERAASAGLTTRDDLGGVDVVISLVPPSAALDTASALIRFAGLYIDANAISPERAAEVAGVVRGAGATYVDGSVIGPPPVAAGTSRMQLSGAAASLAAELFTGSRIEPVIVTEHEYGASAVKMAYAAWTKISAALLLAADAAAASYGVEAVLQAEWARSQPDLARRRERAHAAVGIRGCRGRRLRAASEALIDPGPPQRTRASNTMIRCEPSNGVRRQSPQMFVTSKPASSS